MGQDDGLELLLHLAKINTGTENLQGLSLMLEVLKKEFLKLGAKVEQIPLPPRKKVDAKGHVIELAIGDALRATKHKNAPIKVFLGGHMDTVFQELSPFQSVERKGNYLHGPGVADMKGGLVVLIKSLENLESSLYAGKVGWEAVISPDEEIGSPGSSPLLLEAAKRNHVGLIFEPAFDDGSLVAARKGSANFAIVAYGKSAHAGRDYPFGRNAISALAGYIIAADQLTDLKRGVTLNFGQIEGGTGVNIVPDLAIGRLNVRVNESKDLILVKEQLKQIAQEKQFSGIHFVIHELVERPPKAFDERHRHLFEAMKQCAQEIDMKLKWRDSGGVCDGNTLAAAGLPTIDTLGVVGGQIHTDDEYMVIESLKERSGLVSRFLKKLETGEIDTALWT